MTKKEKEKEQKEINEAVCLMAATIRKMEQRRARDYELEFLKNVRDRIDEQIEVIKDVDTYTSKNLANRIEDALL